MRLFTVHMNPPDTKGVSSCGRKLRFLRWRTDLKDVTCDSCIIIEKHRQWKAMQH